MEFLIFLGNDSMEFEHPLQDFDNFHEIWDKGHVNVCAHAPKVSALLIRRAGMEPTYTWRRRALREEVRQCLQWY